MVMYVGYAIQTETAGVSFKSTNNQLYYAYDTYVADKWSQDTNLPGLGITEAMADNAYTIVLDDNVTTLGLWVDKSEENLFMVGMNTTAASVTVPGNITINGSVFL